MAGLIKIFICFLLQFTLFLFKSPSLPKQYHHNILHLRKKKLAILTSVKQSIRKWTFPFSTYKMTNTYKAHVASCHLLFVLRKMTSTVLAPEPVDWGDPQGRIICAELKKKTRFYSLGFSLNEYINSILIHIPYFQHDCGQEKLQIMKHGQFRFKQYGVYLFPIAWPQTQAKGFAPLLPFLLSIHHFVLSSWSPAKV